MAQPNQKSQLQQFLAISQQLQQSQNQPATDKNSNLSNLLASLANNQGASSPKNSAAVPAQFTETNGFANNHSQISPKMEINAQDRPTHSNSLTPLPNTNSPHDRPNHLKTNSEPPTLYINVNKKLFTTTPEDNSNFDSNTNDNIEKLTTPDQIFTYFLDLKNEDLVKFASGDETNASSSTTSSSDSATGGLSSGSTATPGSQPDMSSTPRNVMLSNIFSMIFFKDYVENKMKLQKMQEMEQLNNRNDRDLQKSSDKDDSLDLNRNSLTPSSTEDHHHSNSPTTDADEFTKINNFLKLKNLTSYTASFIDHGFTYISLTEMNVSDINEIAPLIKLKVGESMRLKQLIRKFNSNQQLMKENLGNDSSEHSHENNVPTSPKNGRNLRTEADSGIDGKIKLEAKD